jgi:hypothetical protein
VCRRVAGGRRGSPELHPPLRPGAGIHMRLSGVSFRPEAWGLLLPGAPMPLVGLMMAWLWTR